MGGKTKQSLYMIDKFYDGIHPDSDLADEW